MCLECQHLDAEAERFQVQSQLWLLRKTMCICVYVCEGKCKSQIKVHLFFLKGPCPKIIPLVEKLTITKKYH